MILLLPKSHPDLKEFRNLPLFFLAGPILGADDWHRLLTELLIEKTGGNCIVVNPHRDYDEAHPHYRYALWENRDTFASQTSWERRYIARAANLWPTGCLIFWLASESVDNPRDDGKPFAMDTRGEIGEIRGRMMFDRSLRVVMGAEPDFCGLETIIKNNEEAVPDLLPIHSTMEEVVSQAIKVAEVY
jgi:hypothetical protein